MLGTTAPGCTSKAPPPRTAQEGRDEVDFSALPAPDNRAALHDLNLRQRRIVRRAQASCGAIEESALGARGCIISFTDAEVAKREDPRLEAFHFALPPRWRYNTERPHSVAMRVHRYVSGSEPASESASE